MISELVLASDWLRNHCHSTVIPSIRRGVPWRPSIGGVLRTIAEELNRLGIRTGRGAR